MDIRFRDLRTQRLFNEHARMIARYGGELAVKATTRMEVLAASRELAMVPASPPIGCRETEGATLSFAVDLDRRHRLRFVPLGASAPGWRDARAVEVVGLERFDGGHGAWRPC